ncbi:protein MMS22-like isoform X2 [Ornithodoros turicata]
MDVESGSMTPPVSPEEQRNLGVPELFEPNDVNMSMLFACDTQQGNAACSIPENAPFIKLFGKAFFRRQFSKSRIQDAFWAARVRFSELFTSAHGRSTAADMKHAQKLQFEVSCFFSYLRYEMERFLDCPELLQHDIGSEAENGLTLSSLCGTVMKEITHTLLCFGPIYNLPDSVLTADRGSSGHILLHISLEAWWTAFYLTHIITTSSIFYSTDFQISFCDMQGLQSTNPFVQITVLILWDLCTLSCKLYTMHDRLGSDMMKYVCPCTCVSRLWTMVIEVINKREAYHSEGHFWAYIDSILEELKIGEAKISKGCIGKFCLTTFPRDYTSKGSLLLWLLTDIAKVYKGACNTSFLKVQEKSNFPMAKKLLQHILLNDKCGEAQMKVVMQCCIALHTLWLPSVDLLLPVTEYIIKNLNSDFQQSKSVAALQQICRSAQQLFHIAKQHTGLTHVSASDTSFDLYLTLLVRCLSKCFESGATNTWKQLRGRFYIKFPKRRMQELTEAGLQNFSLLFLVLAISAELDDVITKMFELLSLLPHATSASKMSVVLKAMFAALLCLQERNVGMRLLAEKVVKWFFSHCLGKVEERSDAVLLQQRSTLIPVYMEGIVDILDSSCDFKLSEHILIAPQLKQLLEQGTHSEQSILLRGIQEGIEKVRMAVKTRKDASSFQQNCMTEDQRKLSTAMYSSVLPFIHKAAMGTSATLPQAAVVDTAAAVTLLAMYMPSHLCIPIKASFSSLFEYFGCSPHVNPRVSSRFLCMLLTEEHVMEHLSRAVANVETQLIRAWLRCAMLIPPPCDHTMQLSRIILKLNEVSRITLGTIPLVKGDHEEHLMAFFQCLEEVTSIVGDTSNLGTKSNMAEELQGYLQTFMINILALLKTEAQSSLLLHVYKTCGMLCRHCSTLLYTRGKPGCVLPELLNVLLTPGSSKRPLAQAQTLAIKQSLPMFLHGLLLLDVKLDSYLQRTFKELITYYLPFFALAQNPLYSTGQHPLLLLLGDLRGTQKMEVYVQLLAESISENIICRKGMAHQHCNKGANFFKDLLRQLDCMSDIRKSAIATFFFPVMENLLHSGPSIDNTPCERLMTMVVEESRKTCKTAEQRKYLVTVIVKFVQKHVTWNTSSVFRLLTEIASLNAMLISDSISDISGAVAKTEEKRGAGPDQVLRKYITNLLSHTEKCKGIQQRL